MLFHCVHGRSIYYTHYMRGGELEIITLYTDRALAYLFVLTMYIHT